MQEIRRQMWNADWLTARPLAVSFSVRLSKASWILVLSMIAFGMPFGAPPARAGFTEKQLEEAESDRKETTERRVHSLASELAATAKRHGTDSVSLQAGLLLHALQAGAVGACEVTVVGASPNAGPSFLEVDVITGLIFDTEASTQSTQIAHVWHAIAAPTLKGMKSFETDPRGLELVFQYGVQRFSELIEHKADPSAPSEARTVRVTIPETALAELAAGSIDVEKLLERSSVNDGSAAIPTTDLRIE